MRDPEAPSLVRLPEHVVLEILARVPGVADLFRCAAARKRWRDLVTEPSFLRRRWPEGACHCSSLVGFLGRERRQGGEGPPGSSFVRAPWSVLGPGRPLLGSFVPGAAGLLDDRVVPLASHRGALLVRFGAEAEAEAEAESGPAVDRLAVCNLLSGACHVLPPLRCDWFFDYFGTSAHAVLTGADCCPDDGQRQALDPASFKVLVVGVSDDRRRYVLRTFSSGEPGWSAPSECFDPVERGIFGPFKRRSAVVSHGTAHWVLWDLVKFHVLDVNAANRHASLQELQTPPPAGDLALYESPHLSVAPNKAATLSSLCLSSQDPQVEIWTRQDGGKGSDEDCGGDWRRDRVVEMTPEQNQIVDRPRCMCTGDRSGTLLITDRCRCMYILHLESGAMEEVTDHLHGLRDYKTAMAVEIDWPAFFVCRLLGGKAHV
ncbi:hypothetical protein ZWY2020_049064 [Hordeum vulgare]|nr:hypothetical protein ZWY2020_049064 [Hordeum vulgare]